MGIGKSLLAAIGIGIALMPLRSEQSKPVIHRDADGRLSYDRDALGNTVPDFSSAGYRGGGHALPHVDAKIRVSPSGSDDTRRIQAAIDWVSELPLGEHGFRGAVELASGEFSVSGQLRIQKSGVVLRGNASADSPTILVAAGDGRRDLIVVGKDAAPQLEKTSREITQDYVPVGSVEIDISDTSGISIGDSIRIVRPGSKAWVEDLGMHKAPARTSYAWRGEAIILHWDREVVSVSGSVLGLDAPITTALDSKYGRSTAQKIVSSRALSNVGVEYIECVSAFSEENPKDEHHSWVAVSLEGAVDSWVSDVVARRFVLSAVRIGKDCRRVTVQDCSFLEPVSEEGGYRRQSFNTYGQQTLFLRCVSEHSYDDFTVGHLTGGPNVFLHCRTYLSKGTSGSLGHWASGLLFDNVHIDGGSLALDNREIWNQGVGWSAANSVIYQCSAAKMYTRLPPTATNWAMGVWAQFYGDGIWIETSQFANPKSLYIAQLEDRLGAEAAIALAKRDAIRTSGNPPELEHVLPELPEVEAAPGNPMEVVNGQLLADGVPLIGKDSSVTWWRGRLLPTRAGDFGYSVSRFTPGRSGSGLTDNLDEMTDHMRENGNVSLRHHYGLWYDRRRDDHEMTRRSSGDVWPPFYEQAFSRSGEGTAWDGLSKYDLFKYNTWYFKRLETFAELAEQKGLVLVNEMFFQHNIIESGGHWVDNPWRPENAIQKTEFTEPPPFTGDTIKMADEFYDMSHPVRREVNKAYIRKCLDNLSGQPNAIHVIGAEYTGPLHFMQFWLDTIDEWMRETGKDPLIGLSCTKDVQDAILADPVRSRLIDIIDFQYWWYTDSDTFEPEGGISLAPRQNVRKWKGGRHSGQSLARMVTEYRQKYPEKAIITALEVKDPWAYALAGGSLAPLPRQSDKALLKAIGSSLPIDSGSDRVWVMKNDRGDCLVRSIGDALPEHSLFDARAEYEIFIIDEASGKASAAGRLRTKDKGFQNRLSEVGLCWLRRI